MSTRKIISRFAVSGVAAGVALAAGAVFAEAQHSTGPNASQPPDGDNPHSAVADHVILSAFEHRDHHEHRDHQGPDAGKQLAVPRLHDGWVELGDSRPSATEAQLRSSKQSDSPPPKRADAGYIPRAGAGIKPSDLDARWSYDFKTPIDSTPLTKNVPVPYPPIHRVVPGDFGVIDNQASVLKEDNRTAAGPRRQSTVSDPKWNLTTTDAKVPGAGRVYRFDMVCPDHAGRMGSDPNNPHAAHGMQGMQGQYSDVYTGASDFNLSKGHQVFSYHWGDPAFNNGFILAHYLAYGLSNTPPPQQHNGHNY